MPRFLLDASALYPLAMTLGERLLDYASELAVLDLTVYEVGNVLWKEYRRRRISDPEPLAQLFEEVFSILTVLRTSGSVADILRLAIRENLTFYDAAYLYATRLHGMRLVTEDRDLSRYPEAMSVQQLLEELGVST